LLCLVLATGYFTSLQVSAAESLQFQMPEESVNGSFVIRVNYEVDHKHPTTQMELWRSYGDGEFVLVSRQPQFHAISQMLYKPGAYRYFLKVIDQESSDLEAIETSDVKTIHVIARHSNLLSSLH